jgi:hypothetical protein
MSEGCDQEATQGVTPMNVLDPVPRPHFLALIKRDAIGFRDERSSGHLLLWHEVGKAQYPKTVRS